MSAYQHILLTSLGVQAHMTEYTWQDKCVRARLAPLALMQLMNDLNHEPRPDCVVAIITDGAMHSRDDSASVWKVFREGIYKITGFAPTFVKIPDGRNGREVRKILEKVAENVPDNVNLTLDVTQGFRHFPFIFYALALYLKSLRGVNIRGAYYGLYEGLPRDEPKPILDLQPLLDLPEWFYAVRMFRDQGTTLPIRHLIAPIEVILKSEAGDLSDPAEMRRTFEKSSSARRATKHLGGYAFAYESALPLELGRAAEQIAEPINALATKECAHLLPPLSTTLIENIVEVADQAALDGVKFKGKWKENVALTTEELDRQARMIDSYLERGQLLLAVGLMREWVVSWMMFNSDATCKWIEPRERAQFERRLGALSWFARNSDNASKVQKRFGTFWNRLTNQLRNALHHNGMRADEVMDPQDPENRNAHQLLREVCDFWKELRCGSVKCPVLGGSRGILLVSPLGTRPGVLFSALKACRPCRCFVICSRESSRNIDEAIRQSSFSGDARKFEFSDHQAGFREIDTAVRLGRDWLLEADRVVANVTGGSTLMGLAVQRFVEEAEKLDRPVRRIALIDRRTRTEQDNTPFVEGECHWLDENAG